MMPQKDMSLPEKRSNIDPDEYIDSACDCWNAAKKESRSNIQLSTFAISNIGSCARRLYYEQLQPGQVRGREQGREGWQMHMGTGIHDVIEKMLTYSHAGSVSTEQEVRMVYGTEHNSEKEITLVGHYDAIVSMPTRNGKYKQQVLLDFKGCNSRAYAMRLKDDNAQPHHVMQVNAYAFIAGVRRFAIVYINRDSGEHQAFIYQTSEALFESCADRLVCINICMRNNIAPEIDCEDWECRYCPCAGHECLGKSAEAEKAADKAKGVKRGIV